MANDNRASYAKIGFTVMLGLAAIVATLIYIGGAGGSDDVFYLETYNDKSVNGLSVGSPVSFRGVKVGEVCEINFVGNKYDVSGLDNQRVYILMAISRRLVGFSRPDEHERDGYFEKMVKDGLRATVTASGITGLARIEFDLCRDAAPPPRITWKPRYRYVPAGVSLLDSFSDSATKVMNQINKMNIASVWSNINSSVESLARVTDGMRVMVETHQPSVDRLMENAADASASLKAAAAEIRRNPSLLIRDRRPARLDETE